MHSSIQIVIFKILFINSAIKEIHLNLVSQNNHEIQCLSPITSFSTYLPKCFHLSTQKLECTNFTTFNQLNFQPCISALKPVYSYIKLKPDKPIIFDNKLDLRHLAFDSKRFQLILENLSGFEITFNPFFSFFESTPLLGQYSQLPYLSIAKSNFKFLYRNNTFDWICDLVMNADNGLKPLLSSFRVVYLGGTEPNDYITYPHSMCPVIFKDARLESVYFFNITLKNRPEFLQFETNQSKLINSVVKNVHIQSSIVKLDHLFLDKNVFKSIEKLSIEFSYLVSIKEDLFRSFNHVKQINLWIFNLRQFLHAASSNENKWLHFINKENTSDQVFIEFNDEKNEYDYSERDFCLFKHFPHENRVFPILKNSDRRRHLNCTCTIVWLLKEWQHAEKNIRTELVSSCFRSKTSLSHHINDYDANFSHYFESLVEKCQLTEKLRGCFAVSYGRSPLKDLFSSSASKRSIFDVLNFICLIYFYS